MTLILDVAADPSECVRVRNVTILDVSCCQRMRAQRAHPPTETVPLLLIRHPPCRQLVM